MQDLFDFRKDRIYLAIDSSQPPDEDLNTAYRRAYGERLEETASMLIQENWYTLTKDSETLQTIISSIKYIAQNIKNIDNNQHNSESINVVELRKELLFIVSCLYRAGERSVEAEFAIRKVRFDEFSECYNRLEIATQLLLS